MQFDDAGINNFKAQLTSLANKLQDFDGLPEAEKNRAFREVIGKIADLLQNIDDPIVADVARKYDVFERMSPRNKPKNVFSFIDSDHLDAFNALLDMGGFPKDPKFRDEEFFGPFPELKEDPSNQPPLFLFFQNMPVNKHLYAIHEGRLTSFDLLTITFLHTRIETLPLEQRIATIVTMISVMADFSILSLDIGQHKVQIGSLDRIYELIIERSRYCASKVLMELGLVDKEDLDIPLSIDTVYSISNANPN